MGGILSRTPVPGIKVLPVDDEPGTEQERSEDAVADLAGDMPTLLQASQSFSHNEPFSPVLLNSSLHPGSSASRCSQPLTSGAPWKQEKLPEVDGIRMHPKHAWADGMRPVVDASVDLEDPPVVIGVAAGSGCGKSTFLRRILQALGTEVSLGHTAVGDMMTGICLDDYFINDRDGRQAAGRTALNAAESDFALMGVQIEALKQKKAVYKPIYNRDTGCKDLPELIEPNKVIVVEGLLPFYDEKVRSLLDLSIYIDIVKEVRFAWMVNCGDILPNASGTATAGTCSFTSEQVCRDVKQRRTDFSKYVDPQKASADVVLRYEPSGKGSAFLKVKLIQKKGSAFPMIRLKKDISFTGSEPGATLRTYDDHWLGHDVAVVEMDGEIDMDNFEEQLKEIEANIEGMSSEEGALTKAMVGLKSMPGSENGTGLLQTVIAIKVHDVYKTITGKVAR